MFPQWTRQLPYRMTRTRIFPQRTRLCCLGGHDCFFTGRHCVLRAQDCFVRGDARSCSRSEICKQKNGLKTKGVSDETSSFSETSQISQHKFSRIKTVASPRHKTNPGHSTHTESQNEWFQNEMGFGVSEPK